MACTEQKLSHLSDDEPLPGAQDTVDTGSGVPPDPVEEVCDGMDNDNDGFIDEGFPDTDGDGHADCVDDACEVEVTPTGLVTESNTCSSDVVPAVDPWDVEVLRDITPPSGWCRIDSAADLDGDGTVELVCSSNVLYILDSVTGAVEWMSTALGYSSATAVADLDGDGDVDVVGFGDDGAVVAFDGGTGDVLWRTDAWVGWDQLLDGAIWPGVEVANVNDLPEVITPLSVVHGWDGGVVTRIDGADSRDLILEAMPLGVGDMDRDGEVDVAVQGWVFGVDGELKWWADQVGEQYLVPSPLQADTDDEAEVLWFTGYGWELDEADGTAVDDIVVSTDTHAACSIPCIADVDGDGLGDILWANSTAIHAWTIGGEEIWSTPISDYSCGSACSTFDFDLDGTPDVILAAEHSLLILDGSTGEIRYEDSNRESLTIWEYPIVIDLDGDGSAEIVMTSTGEFFTDSDPNIRIYGNRNRDWPPGAPLWGSGTWSGTSLQADGTVPRTAEAPWLTTGIWRGQVTSLPVGADLRPEVMDSCVSSCEDPSAEVRLSVRLVNLGPAELDTDTPLSLFLLDDAGSREFSQTWSYAELVDSGAGFFDNGTATASVEVVLTLEQAERGLILAAGEDASGNVVVRDCAVENNELEWRTTACD